jgi:tetratricopeptide (TPR) repeat protein
MDAVMAMDEIKQFTTRDAARILNATEARVRSLARIGGVKPHEAQSGLPEFSFQELLLLRTTRGLLEAGIPPGRVRRVWSSLRRQLEADLPLTSVRILADGNRAVAWHQNAAWQPDSGQFLLHFDGSEIVLESERPVPVRPVLRAVTPQREIEPAPASESVPAPVPLRRLRSSVSPEQWFHIACELEETSPIEARHAYREALDGDPDYVDAHINLGRLHHEDGELEDAERHYRNALRVAPDEFIGHFNLAVLLEDLGRMDEAAGTYRRALELDADSADTHYNLGLLLESLGRRDDAMRHLMNARRLTKPSQRKRGTI